MAYTPSLWRVNKYAKYLAYYTEFIKRLDFKSVFDSIKYVMFKSLPKHSRIIETGMGKFLIRPNTTDFQFVNFTYEKEIKDHLLCNINEIGTFIDIGACIGEYCIWLSKNGVQTYAFEPVNYLAIEHNYDLNKANFKGSMAIFPFALGKETRRLSFNVLEGVTSSSYADLDVEDGEIECRVFDELFDVKFVDKTKITFIKLDVEGMELDVLEGAKEFIKSTPNLQIAYEYTSVGDDKIRNFLRSIGKFAFFDLDGVNTLAIKQ